MNTSLQVCLYIVAVGGALAAIAKWVVIPVARMVRRVAQFLEDWLGEPERPGDPGRAGVMERLARLEHQTARAEFHLGNGNPKPLREIVESMKADVDELKQRP